MIVLLNNALKCSDFPSFNLHFVSLMQNSLRSQQLALQITLDIRDRPNLSFLAPLSLVLANIILLYFLFFCLFWFAFFFSVYPFDEKDQICNRRQNIKHPTALLQVKKRGKGPFYLTSVVPSVLQTRDCYHWKPTVLYSPCHRFTGIQSYSYTDGRRVEADVEVTEDRTGTSRSESRALANWATTALWTRVKCNNHIIYDKKKRKKKKKKTSPVSSQPSKLPHSWLRQFTQLLTAVAGFN